MPQPQNPFLAKIMPFIGLGVFIVLLVVGIVVSFYILVWGVLIGSVVFLIAWLKNKFCPNKNKVNDSDDDNNSGRVIDHDKL